MDPTEERDFPLYTDTDRLLETLLVLPFLGAVEVSLERIIDRVSGPSERNDAIEKAIQLGAAIQEAARRLARKQATVHNLLYWSLPHDLTVRVFSMLDTRSVFHAAATCSMFNKCAMDPMCYASIDLTSVTSKMNNSVVFRMIQRAGKNLQSLKLGMLQVIFTESRSYPAIVSPAHHNPVHTIIPPFYLHDGRMKQGKETCLTRSCLLPLSLENGSIGALLRRLHLYNIDGMDSAALHAAISVCTSLVDFEVVGLHIDLKVTLECVGSSCPYLERLFFQSSGTGRDETLKSQTCSILVNGCPLLSSLALRGFKLSDHKVRMLIKGFRHLKVIDFSSSYSVTGIFLRTLSSCTSEPLVEVLILRDCLHLKEVEVDSFLSAVLGGSCKFLRCLDISNKDGLASIEDWSDRSYSPCHQLIKRLFLERPKIHLVAQFPMEKSGTEQLAEDEMNSYDSTSLTASSVSMDYSSGGTYSSDPGSGNEDVHNAGLAEWSDEADYFI